MNKISKYAFRGKVLLENIKHKPFAISDKFYGNNSFMTILYKEPTRCNFGSIVY